MNNIPESDWKYLRNLKAELLNTLCKRINEEAAEIATDSPSSQHEKFLRLFSHVMEKNQIIADCFDDWRRSNIFLKLLLLEQYQLLTEEHISRLSEETRAKINLWESRPGST
jgi:hypothetical protein